MIKYFHQYLKGKGNQKPLVFSIAIDGSYGTYWYNIFEDFIDFHKIIFPAGNMYICIYIYKGQESN